ncbi:hypothetical protein IAI10_16500 [Clostridium sp. 19966]|uniref:hypothetical protein n=1 Tax=Clostridium sp. 19966 TaxID=2768166 RepID=UPI0028E05EB2|nr:hypothetical protein [Clostridium sp. 19966]MDT8718269.1 hypothetical protein [Clostridium sp. 19966]
MAMVKKSLSTSDKRIEILGKIGELEDRKINWLINKAIDQYIEKYIKESDNKELIELFNK